MNKTQLSFSTRSNVGSRSLNKTMTNFSPNTSTSKITVTKRIISISSLKPPIKKALTKILQCSPSDPTLTAQYSLIQDQAKVLLDVEKNNDFVKEMENVKNAKDKSFDGYSITQIISPIERSYITKIQKQLKEDENLQKQIQTIENQIMEEKDNKLNIYSLQKNGKVLTMSTKTLNHKTDIQNYQNKLMRSNQKLNELSSNNNKLREQISRLRKQKNSLQIVYDKLKQQLVRKNESVQSTIKFANEANNARYVAQKNLKSLKQQAETKKMQFKKQCEKINQDIQHDLKFKAFIKSKQIQKTHLETLESQILLNEQQISEKRAMTQKIESSYKKSLSKQLQIKRSFQAIRREIGVGEAAAQQQGRQLVRVFNQLYLKNSIMSQFVQELGKEVSQLQEKISEKKKQIHQMYLKGSADQPEKQKLNEELKQKVSYQKRKKQILDDQYKKSLETVDMIKYYLIQIFQEVHVDKEITQKLKNCNINEENLTQFLGELEKKGLEAISNYSKLVGEQLKLQKGNSWQIQKQIQELNNVITIQNVNMMNSGGAKVSEYPSQLLLKLKQEKTKDQQLDKPLTLQEFKKFAIDSLEKFQKKQVLKQKPVKNKFSISQQNVFKSKKKSKQNYDSK